MPRPVEKRQAQEAEHGGATLHGGPCQFAWARFEGRIDMPLCRRAYLLTGYCT